MDKDDKFNYIAEATVLASEMSKLSPAALFE